MGREVEMSIPQKWKVMGVVASGIFLATLDGSIVNIALPTLVKEFRVQFATVQWVVLAYLLTLVTLMPNIGRLADMKGAKPLYSLGLLIFTVGSMLCGLSPSVEWLIGFRVLQGAGAAMLAALGAAILTEAFPPNERGKALGISGSIVSVGIITGPVLGGLLIDILSWHWIFFVNIPVGIAGIFAARKFLPAPRPQHRQRFDFPGALFLFISLTSLLIALTQGQTRGFSHPFILGLFVSWLVFLLVFLRIERRAEQPLVDLQLFRDPAIVFNLTSAFTTFVAIAGTVLLMPFYLENILGYDTRHAGMLLSVTPLAITIVSPLAGTLSDRYGSRRICIAGMATILAGYASLSTLTAHTTVIGYILRFLPVGIGMAMFQSPNSSAIMGSRRRGAWGWSPGCFPSPAAWGRPPASR